MHWHQVPVSLRPAYNSRMDSAVSAESGSTTVSSSGTSLFDNLNPAAVPRRRRRRRSWSDADSLTDAEVHDAGLAGEQQWRKERSQSVKEKASPSVNKLKKRRPASSISPTAPLPPISRTLSCPDGVELAHYTEKASQGSTRSARRSFSFINSQQQRATLAAAAHIVLPRKAFKRRSSLPATSHEPESRPEDVFVPAPSQLDWFMDASPFAVAHPRHHHHRRTQSTPSSVIQKPEFVVDVIGDRGRSFTPSGSSDSIAPGDKDKTARAASVDGRSSHKKSATTSVTTLSPPTHACAHADPAPPAQSQFVTAGHPLSLPVQSGQQPTHSPAYGQISVESQAETDLFAKRALMRSRTLQQLSSTSPDRRYQSFDVNAAIDRSDPAFLTAGEGQFAGPDGDLQHQHQQQQRHLRYRDSLLLPQTDPRPSAARTLHSTHRHQQQQQQSTSPAKSTSSQKYHHHHYHLPSTSPSRPPWTTTKRSRSEPAVLTSQGDQVADSDLHQTMRLPVFHISPGTKHAELEPICTTRARPGKAEAPLGCSRGSNSSSLLSGGNQLELRQHEEHKNIHPRDLDLRQCVSSELAHAQAHYDPGVIDAGPNPDLEEEEGEEDHTSLTNKLGLSFQQPRPHSSRRRPSSVRACLAPQPQSQSQPPSRQPTSKHLRPPLAPPRRSSLQIPVPQPPPASLDPLLALPPAAREMVLRHRQNSEARLSSADVERQQAQQQQHQTVRAVKSSVLTHTRSPSANASAYAHDPRSASSSSSLLTGDNAPDTPPTDLSSRNTSEGPCASQASHAPASQDDIAGLLAPTPRCARSYLPVFCVDLHLLTLCACCWACSTSRTHRREASAPERPRWRTSWGLLGAGEDSVFSTHPLSQGGSDPSSPASSSPKLGLARRLSQRLVRGITSPKMSDADVDAPPLPVPAVPASSPNKLRKDPPKKLDTLKKPHRYSAEGAPPPRAVPRILTDLKSDVAQEHEAPTQSSSSSSLPASPSMTPGLGHRPQVSAPACRIRSYRSKSSDPLEFLRGARRASAVDSNNSCSTSSSNDPSQDHSYETVPSTVLHTVQESWSATSPLQAIERPEAPLAVPDTRSSVLREFRDREADYSRRLVKLHQVQRLFC